MKKIIFPLLSLFLFSPVFAQQQNLLITTAKTFFSYMELGKFHEAYLMLDSSVMKVVSETQNTNGWKQIRKKLGAFRKQINARSEEMKPYTGVFLTTQFDSALVDFKVMFKGNEKIIGYFLVPPGGYKYPSYVDSNALIERNIEVKTGNITLSGKLTLPKKGDHFPVVVLVHGSGPSDKDETVGLNKPFKDIALGLATMGIASIRYDKRTYVYGIKSASPPESITLKEETIDDALSALHLAQTIKEIDPKKIYLLSHSLGAMAAPRIAKQAPFIAGIIFMAGNARPFEDVIADQMSYVLPLQLPRQKADSVFNEILMQVERIRHNNFTDTTSGAKLPLGLSAVYWRDMKNYDQVATAKSLTMPMLFLQGEKDYQVTMKDFALWKKSLAGKKNAEFISYPGLFHLFMPGEGNPKDYEKAGHVSEKVVSDIAKWIGK